MSRLERLFFQGAHSEVARLTVDSAPGRTAKRDLATVIGALSFLGRLEEAEALFEERARDFDAESLSAARFYLGITFCRHSNYARARHYLVSNLRATRRARSLRQRFYAFQGLAFYRFYSGRFARSEKAARRAQAYAGKVRFLWGKLLATDLLGHCSLERGQVSLGIKLLQQARTLARSLGDGGIGQAIEVSMICAKARFGLSHQGVVRELRAAVDQLSTEDTYSRSALLLELGRQYLLRGNLDQSRAALGESCPFIYASQNRRHGIILNLRYAELHFQAGEYAPALNLIRSSRKELDPAADRALHLELLGLQSKLTNALEMTVPNEQPLLERLTRETGGRVSARVLSRGREQSYSEPRGEDPLGDLLDRLRDGTKGGKDLEALCTELFRTSYLGFLPALFAVSRAERTLLLDPIPGALAVIDRGNVSCRTHGLSPIFRKIILTLVGQGSEVSKEELIQKVWGYRYRPINHDPLIYSAVSRLRHLLGAQASAWIEVTERGYSLRAGVQVRIGREPPAQVASQHKSAPVTAPPPSELGMAHALNIRQIAILKAVDRNESINVRDCLRQFKVSEITASRDLSQLARIGLLVRIGKARATCYVKPLA